MTLAFFNTGKSTVTTDHYSNSLIAQSPRVTFPGSTDGMLAQQVRFYYQQTITRLYEVGSKDVYLINGHTYGESHFDGAVGSRATAAVFYKRFTDVCPTNRSLSVSSASNSEPPKRSIAKESSLVLDNCFIGHVIQAIASKEMTTQDLVMLFLNMTLVDSQS